MLKKLICFKNTENISENDFSQKTSDVIGAELDAQGISEDVQHITGRVSSRRVFPDRSRALKHS